MIPLGGKLICQEHANEYVCVLDFVKLTLVGIDVFHIHNEKG